MLRAIANLRSFQPGLRLAARTKPCPRPFSRPFSNTPTPKLRYERFGDAAGGPHGKPRQTWWDPASWDRRTRILAAVVAGGGVYYVAHLEVVPETGRVRFMDVGPKMEARLTQASREQLQAEFGNRTLPPNHPLTRHVHRIVTRILEANNLGHLKSAKPAGAIWFDDPYAIDDHASSGAKEWELMVVKDDKIVNAMASFGTVIVFTGILPMAKNEEGLAAILGHEIGHAVARHSLERYSSSKIFLVAATLLSMAGLDFGLSQMLSTLLLDLPNSRKQELEADAIGLRLAARACYDPKAAPEVFARMDSIDKSNRSLNVNFLYTHPTFETRIERLNKLLPEAYNLRAQNPECARMEQHIAGFRDAMGTVRGSPAGVWGWA